MKKSKSAPGRPRELPGPTLAVGARFTGEEVELLDLLRRGRSRSMVVRELALEALERKLTAPPRPVE
jgi:hypothetical protein